MKQYAPYLAGIGFASIFGLSFMFTRGALEHLAPFHLLGLRFAMAITFFTLLRLTGLIKISTPPQIYKDLLPLAIFQPLIYFSAETTGVLLTSASYAGMMIAVIPIFVAILAATFLGERPSRIQTLFILTSVAGVIFITTMDNQSNVDANPLGTLALLGAVLAGACYNITSRRASAKYTPVQITWVMMLIGAVTFNTIAIIQHLIGGNLSAYLTPLPLIWPAVLYLGGLSSVLAFFLINFSLSKLTAAQSSVFANLVTVIAITAGVLFRGEAFYWYHALGAVAILAGVWGTNRHAASRFRKQTTKSA
ncbi:MAG: DMT family transporter [Firmicutes bacterium]|nr:DMT family transporter [Bacillota bacterium]